ncbi:MAG: hypothetical protein A2X40_05395 [Elusimicrobia bacterium GWC2_65_9]|nr:MAG: hypothetical protein A2X37_09020 [Elusimicrobia bacterium GWA2_66_18]OGR71761.1 MAG: hypothetical protein A2X40_05395 [Elusimicrobia bacterium GWC2_65_9]
MPLASPQKANMPESPRRPAPQRRLAAALCAALSVAAPDPLSAQAAARIVGNSIVPVSPFVPVVGTPGVASSLGLPRSGPPSPAPPTAPAIPARAAQFPHPFAAGPVAMETAVREDIDGAVAGSRENFDRAAHWEGAGVAQEAGEVVAAAAESAPAPQLQPPGRRGTSDSPSERKLLDLVSKKLGPIIDETDAPALYEFLDEAFGRLSAAQQRLFPTEVVAVNHVYVVDTPAINAFVYPVKEAGVRRFSNHVFITTGLLKKMLDSDPAALREGVVRIVGVLSHELAHPLDNADAEGILANYGREAGGQARETRADSEGAMIAKKAGYPVESVYEGLKRLFVDDRGDRGLLASLADTHPHNDLRLAAQRLLLTLDRYENGTSTPKYPGSVGVALLGELARLNKGAALGAFVALKDLGDALDRLKKLRELQRGDAYKTIEFNRILLALDAMLMGKGAPLSDEEFRTFTEIILVVAKSGAPEVLDREAMKRFFTAESHSAEFLAYPSHAAFMKKIAAYNSPRYLAWIGENFFFKKEKSYGDVERTLHALAKALPCEHAFALFGERIAEDLHGEMHLRPSLRYVYENRVAKGMSPEFQARLAVLFHAKILPRLSEEERISFLIDSTLGGYSYVFPQYRDRKAKDYGLGILKQRTLLMGDPRLWALQQEYRGVLRSLWENRGYYGALDLITESQSTDWDAIFFVLGIDPRDGRSQLRSAVKRFTGTPAYAAMVKTIRESQLEAFRFFKLGKGMMADVDWIDDTLASYLSGDFNDALKGDPELRDFAKQVFAASYYDSRQGLYRQGYRRRMAQALASAAPAGVSIGRLAVLHEATLQDLLGAARIAGGLYDVQAELLDAAPLSEPDKRTLLKAVFLEGYTEAKRVSGLTYNSAGEWLHSNGGRSKRVLRILVKNGLVSGPLDLFSRLAAREEFRASQKGDGWTNYVSAVSSFKDELLADLDAALAQAPSPADGARVLQRFAETVVDPADGDYPAVEIANTPELRDIKTRLAALASSLEPGFADGLKLFRRLTGSGATPSTDAFFQKRLEPVFDEKAAADAGLALSTILEKGRISGTELQLSLTRRVVEPEVRRQEGRPAEVGALNRLIETINAYVRQGSLKKDEFLESLAWRLGLGGRELGAFIEDEKSYNWRKANPLLLRFGSALSSEIGRLSSDSRDEFIRFLIEPEGRELPAAILKELEKNSYQTALALDLAQGKNRSKSAVKAQSDRAAYLMKLEIEAALIDASPFERIPLFELLLSAGDRALLKAEDFPYNVIRPFLKYAPDSTGEKMLAAFLAVVPAHERSVNLAYLLSQAGSDKTSVKHTFEAFQTVGIKFGQMSSTWKLFGEEIARQTASLKSSARPMSKAEILEVARRELSAEEFAKIRRLKRVIGSASLKTVVIVELVDGREVVMMLRRPRAAEQIEGNLRLGREFLRELDLRGLSSASAMFESILEAVRAQLAEELKMTKEARSIGQAGRHYEALNRSMGPRLGGWRFEAPRVVDDFQPRDSILFMELASGATFERLSARDRAQVGPLIAESSLRLLLREGWFDADRHTGNQLIDPERKVIYPIDFGQATEFSKTAFWKRDDRYELAQFLRALGEGNAGALVVHGRAMSAATAPADLSALKTEVAKILVGGGSMADRIIALVTAFAGQGVAMEGRFTFGAFKGLMTLYGEAYVPEEGFRRLLAGEIARILKAKFPVAALDARRGSAP